MERPQSLRLGVSARYWLYGVVLYACLAAGVLWLVDLGKENIRSKTESLVARSVLSTMSLLENEINANAFLLNGLAAFVKARPDFEEQEINAALEYLYDSGRHLRNVGVAPGNRLSFVYPREGNAAAIGLYYPDDPTQWPAVKQAIDHGSTVLAGPVDLIQGGSGLISRTPVFLEDGSYWGILSLVLDTDSILEEAGVDSLTEIDIAIRGENGRGADGEVIFGDPALFDANPVLVDVRIPGGVWQVAAQPSNGWETEDGLLELVEAIALVVGAIAAFAVPYILRRGRQLSQVEERLKTILHTSRDAVLIISGEGHIARANPAAASQFGYHMTELEGENIQAILPGFPVSEILATSMKVNPGELPPSQPDFGVNEGQARGGRRFPIEFSLGETMIDEDVHFVLTIRDISERKNAEEKLRKLADTDFLTGIYNRRIGLSLAEKSLASAKRYQRDLAVMMIDADHFKSINDTWGHDTGDQVLIELVNCIQSVLRNIDIFCRMGGEEFLVVLPETDLAEARLVGERLLAAIRQLRLHTGTGHVLSFTVSIGVAGFKSPADSVDGLISRADHALYQAKAGGRDRVATENDRASANRHAI